MFWFDIVDPQELTGFIRELQFADFTLDRWLPNQYRADIEYAFTRSDRRREDMARYRTFDTESEIGTRPGFARVRGEIPPISKKIVLGEEQRLRLQMAQGQQEVAGLLDSIFDDAALLTESILARIEYARGQVLSTGTVTFTNDRGFVDAEVDYQIPGGNFDTVATAWSNAAAGTPLSDMRAAVQAYMDANNGRRPAAALTSTAAISSLILSDQVRDYAGVGATIPSILTEAQVQAIFAAHGLPPFIAYDTQVSIDGVATRVIPADKVVLLPEPSVARFGETTFGVTAEALELVGSGYGTLATAPGLTGVNMKTFDPVHIWTKVAGIAIPVLKDPNLVYVLDVAP